MFNIGTYSCRSLRTDVRVTELKESLEEINWSIIGLSKIQREGQMSISLSSGNDLYYSGNSTKKHGVVFMVKKSLAENVTGFRGISDRIAELTVQIKKTTRIQLIQVHIPTCSNFDEVELIYKNVNKLLKQKVHQ